MHLNAVDRGSTLKIYHSVFSALSPKTPLVVYTNDNEYRDVFQHSKKIVLTDNAKESDIVLITNESNRSTTGDFYILFTIIFKVELAGEVIRH